MALAIAKLLAPDGSHLGTAFAVSEFLALTAFHCIGDRMTGVVNHRKTTLRWRTGPHRSNAEYVGGDTELDYALLEIRPKLKPEFDLKPLNIPNRTPTPFDFESMGFPTALREVEFPKVVGEVRSYDTLILNRVPAIQLYCKDAASGLSLRGMSGAPVIVGPDMALGLIRWNPEDKDGLAMGGMVFATLVLSIFEQRPVFFRDAKRFRFDPSPFNVLGHPNWPPA